MIRRAFFYVLLLSVLASLAGPILAWRFPALVELGRSDGDLRQD